MLKKNNDYAFVLCALELELKRKLTDIDVERSSVNISLSKFNASSVNFLPSSFICAYSIRPINYLIPSTVKVNALMNVPSVSFWHPEIFEFVNRHQQTETQGYGYSFISYQTIFSKTLNCHPFSIFYLLITHAHDPRSLACKSRKIRNYVIIFFFSSPICTMKNFHRQNKQTKANTKSEEEEDENKQNLQQ